MEIVKTVLLTGATGFVGKNLLPKLLEKNFKVTVFLRNKGAISTQKKLKIFVGNFEDQEVLSKALFGVEAIIHLAAVIKGSKEEYYRVNVLGTKNLLAAAKKNKIGKIIYLSTDRAAEEAPDDYGKTKYEAEQLIENCGLDYTIFKCPTIYGAGDKVLTKLIKLIKISPVVFIFGTGKYKLQPVYIEDVSRALVESIDNLKAKNRTYYLAASKPVTFIEFVDLVADKFNKKIFKIFLPYWLTNFLTGSLGQQFKHLARGNTFDVQPFINDFKFVPREISEGIELTVKQLS